MGKNCEARCLNVIGWREKKMQCECLNAQTEAQQQLESHLKERRQNIQTAGSLQMHSNRQPNWIEYSCATSVRSSCFPQLYLADNSIQKVPVHKKKIYFF